MTKKNLILGVILVFLIVSAWAYQGPFKKWQEGAGKEKNFLAGIEMDKVSKLEIAKAGAVTIMEKSGDKWKIGGTKDFYAKTDEINLLINALKEAETADLELVSENKDKKVEFQTDNESGTGVKLFGNGQQIVDFIVGKYGNDFSSSYISKSDTAKTYLVKVNLAGNFMIDDWRDNIILTGDKIKITKIRFQYPNREFTIEKKGENWEGTKPNKFSVSKEKVDIILTSMTSLSAVKIPEQIFKDTGLEKSKIIVQATGEGVDNTLMVGNESKADKAMFFAKRGTSDNIYLISQDERDKLDKKPSDLK